AESVEAAQVAAVCMTVSSKPCFQQRVVIFQRWILALGVGTEFEDVAGSRAVEPVSKAGVDEYGAVELRPVFNGSPDPDPPVRRGHGKKRLQLLEHCASGFCRIYQGAGTRVCSGVANFHF